MIAKDSYSKKKLIYDIIILFIMGLTPLLWFKSGYSINGPDVSFPLNPSLFFYNRLFTWNHVNNLGLPSAINITSVFFHSIQALFYKLSNSIYFTQPASYCFWFFGICASMYYFIAVVQKDKPNRLQRFTAVLVYALNPLVFNIWEVAKAAEISALVATPLMLAFFIQGLDGRMPFLKAALLSGLCSLVFSEIGASPSVFAIPFGILIGYFIFTILREMLIKSGVKRIFLLCCYLLIFISVYILFNLYWILPYGFEIFKTLKDTATASPLEAFNMVNWLKGISTHTSIFNVSRFQGAWDWYYAWYDEQYVAYAKSYFNNPILLLISIAIPALAYMAIIFKKGWRVIYFAIVALIATIFATGVHPPFGVVFTKIAQRIPIFLVFRSPYYKFSLATLFAYAYLISCTVVAVYEKLGSVKIFEKLKVKFNSDVNYLKIIPSIFILLVFFSLLYYSYPMLTGAIIPVREKMFSLHLKVPNYVFETSRWLDEQEGQFRVMMLPDEKLDTYRWGYGAPINLLNLSCNVPIVWGPASYGRSRIRDIFYRDAYSDKTNAVYRLPQLLSVKYLWLKHDCWYDFYGPTLSPSQIKDLIGKSLEAKYLKSIGEWDFYEFPEMLPLIDNKDDAFLIFGDENILINLAERDYLMDRVLLFFDDNDKQNIEALLDEQAPNDVLFYNHHAEYIEEISSNLIRQRSNSINYIYETTSMPFSPNRNYKLPDYINIERVIGFAASTKYDDANDWLWLVTNKQPNLIINNQSQNEQLINFSFDTFSYNSQRSLYIYLNDELLKFPMCEADKVQQIRLKRLNLKPGKNIISFYTPYLPEVRRGKEVTFAFKDFNLGGLEFSGSFYVPQKSNYRFTIYPLSLNDKEILYPKEEKYIMVNIDGRNYNLNFTNDYIYKSEKIIFDKGGHEFKMTQFLAEDYNIEIISDKLNFDKDKNVSIPFKMHNPTRYTVDNTHSKPTYLLFNESFDSNWKLYDGRKDGQKEIGVHLKANSYANTWFINNPAKGIYTIDYWPQRLFYLGVIAALLMVLVSLIYFSFNLPWKK